MAKIDQWQDVDRISGRLDIYVSLPVLYRTAVRVVAEGISCYDSFTSQEVRTDPLAVPWQLNSMAKTID